MNSTLINSLRDAGFPESVIQEIMNTEFYEDKYDGLAEDYQIDEHIVVSTTTLEIDKSESVLSGYVAMSTDIHEY